MKKFISTLLILLIYASVSEASGQTCRPRPAALGLIVHDSRGKTLSAEQLQAVKIQPPEPALSIHSVDLAADATLVGTSTKETKTKLPVLHRSNNSTCRLDIREMTLEYKGRKMRLIFNLEINRKAYYINSPKFQRGTFELDKNSLPQSGSDRIIPATIWKKIGDK